MKVGKVCTLGDYTLLHHIFMLGFMDGYVLQCDLSSPKTKRGRPVNEDAVHKNRKNQNQKRKQ